MKNQPTFMAANIPALAFTVDIAGNLIETKCSDPNITPEQIETEQALYFDGNVLDHDKLTLQCEKLKAREQATNDAWDTEFSKMCEALGPQPDLIYATIEKRRENSRSDKEICFWRRSEARLSDTDVITLFEAWRDGPGIAGMIPAPKTAADGAPCPVKGLPALYDYILARKAYEAEICDVRSLLADCDRLGNQWVQMDNALAFAPVRSATDIHAKLERFMMIWGFELEDPTRFQLSAIVRNLGEVA